MMCNDLHFYCNASRQNGLYKIVHLNYDNVYIKLYCMNVLRVLSALFPHGQRGFMEKLHFLKYNLAELLRIRKLSTAHYFTKITSYATPSHKHDAWELVFCVSGQVDSYQEEEHKVIRANQVVLHAPRLPHCLKVGNTPTTLFILSFVCNSDYMRLLQNRILETDLSQKRVLMMIIQELNNAFELKDGQLQLGVFHPNRNPVLGSEQMIADYTEVFLISLLRSVTNQREKKCDSDALARAMENHLTHDIKCYIDEHLAERITYDDITKYVHYSRSHITALFQKAMGMSISKYIAMRRIERAKEMLSSGEHTVSQISELLGFSSVQYFSKFFKDTVGQTPSSYQNSLRP